MTKKPEVQIRAATAMDAVAIAKLIKAAWKETSAVELAEVVDQKLVEYVTAALRCAFALVADQDGRVVGTVAVSPISLPWCNEVVMAETWFAVLGAFRDREVPHKLLSALEEFLDKEQLPVMLGTQMLAPSRFDMYFTARQGYEAMRVTYLRVPEIPAQTEVASA